MEDRSAGADDIDSIEYLAAVAAQENIDRYTQIVENYLKRVTIDAINTGVLPSAERVRCTYHHPIYTTQPPCPCNSCIFELVLPAARRSGV